MRAARAGSADDAVLARALGEQRVLLTFDKDFGALVVRAGMAASCGVVLFRMRAIEPDALASWVLSSLDSRSDWSGSFAVVEVARVRLRRLPPVRYHGVLAPAARQLSNRHPCLLRHAFAPALQGQLSWARRHQCVRLGVALARF